MDALFEALFSAVGEFLSHALGELLSPLLEVLGTVLLGVLEGFVELMTEWLFGRLLHLAAAPFFCVVATPVVFIDACFGSGSYVRKVALGYRDLCRRVTSHLALVAVARPAAPAVIPSLFARWTLREALSHAANPWLIDSAGPRLFAARPSPLPHVLPHLPRRSRRFAR